MLKTLGSVIGIVLAICFWDVILAIIILVLAVILFNLFMALF